MERETIQNELESALPAHMLAALRRYIDERIAPGGFLTAVLCNDLKQAAGQADHINKHLLFEYVAYLYNCAPSECWGSPERFQQWLSNE